MNNLNTFNELITKAINYHLERINQNMEEAVRQGKLSITYTIPSVLIEEPRFRETIDREITAAEWVIQKQKVINDETSGEKWMLLTMSCIELEGDEENGK